MKDMILAASISVLLCLSSASSLLLPISDGPIYDLKLSPDLTFQWQIEYDKEEIYVEVSLLHHETGKTIFCEKYIKIILS